MLNFCSLYSGSTGNCLFVQGPDTNIIIDNGVSVRKVEQALESINVKPENISAILVTHEHSDHTKGLGFLSKKYNIPVYANLETWNAIAEDQLDKISEENRNTFNIDEEFEINELKFKPFSIPHDAVNPCGFSIFQDKTKISVATDLGHVTPTVFDNLKGSSFVLLESNYEPEVLKFSKYPYVLKKRIDGPYGHLSNIIAGKTLSKLIPLGLNQAMLGHLSKENNFPELALKTVAEELEKDNITNKDAQISVASRTAPGKLFKIV